MLDDWTRHFDTQLTSPAGRSVLEAFRRVDWSATSLGPTETWSQVVRANVRYLFQLSTPAALYLGPDAVLIYNPGTLDVYKERHPFMMGKPIAVAFADLADQAIVDFIRHHLESGTNGHVPASPVKLNRTHEPRDNVDADDTHDLSSTMHVVILTWDIIPLTDDAGSCYGIMLPWTDGTELFFARAREQFARKSDLFKIHAAGGTLPEAYAVVSDAFESEPLLFPMALLFERTRSPTGAEVYRCCVNVGSKDGEVSTLDLQDTPTQAHQLHHFLSHVCATKQAEEFHVNLDACSRRSLGEQARYALVHPIYMSDTDDSPDWILVLSANPLRPLDTAHRDSLRSTCETISAGLKYLLQNSALKVSEKRFTEVIEFLPIGVLLGDRHTGVVHFVNPYWRNLYNVPDNLECSNPRLFATAIEAIHPSSQQVIDDYYAIDDESKHLDRVDIRMKMPPAGGSLVHPEDQVWYQVSTRYIGDEVVIVSTDVSEYHNGLRRALALSKLELDRNIERHRADLAEQQTNKHLEFIDYISHELRNPLGAVFHCVEMGLEKLTASVTGTVADLAVDLDDSFRTINLCARHMQRIMDDTLLFSQLQSGKLSICMVPTNVPGLMETVLNMFRSECYVRSIELKADTTNWRHGNASLLLDPHRITQIVINLVTNSMKFASKTRQGVIHIQLSSLPVDESDLVDVTLAVVDNGLPMKDEEIAKLFQRFQQANKKTHVDYGGSGLGLYICHALMQLMDGSIKASRNELGGTTFAVHFRAAKAPTSSALHTLGDSGTTVPAVHGPEPGLPSGLKASTRRAKVVLLVEDNLVNQRLIAKQLQKSGYSVLVANNGQEALDIFTSIASPSIDICLCDIEMPVMDGYQTVERVRSYQAEQKLPSTPFIAISANARPEQIQRQLDSGMTATLAKPFTFASLVASLESTFAKSSIQLDGS